MTTTASAHMRDDDSAERTHADARARNETVTVRVRYFAGARAAAGVPAEDVILSSTDQITVDDVLADITRRHGAQLQRVLGASGFLVDGVTVRERSSTVPHGSELDVLPPFAGG